MNGIPKGERERDKENQPPMPNIQARQRNNRGRDRDQQGLAQFSFRVARRLGGLMLNYFFLVLFSLPQKIDPCWLWCAVGYGTIDHQWAGCDPGQANRVGKKSLQGPSSALLYLVLAYSRDRRKSPEPRTLRRGPWHSTFFLDCFPLSVEVTRVFLSMDCHPCFGN